jgi:hypothetical protein
MDNLTREPWPDKTCPMRKARILRTANCPHFHGFCGRLGRSLWISGKCGGGVEIRRIGPFEPGRAINSPAFHNMAYRADPKNTQTGGFGLLGSG